MSDSGSALNVGTVIASTYEVVRLLGRGGMGEVWLARHLRLPGKQVAIKVLRTGGQLPAEVLSRFRHEAEVVTRIGHPNIVEVHDFNALPTGEPYLVLEFLQGESLGSRLLKGRPPLDEVNSIVKQVGAALAASHAIGVVHRDLKPDNIFLVPSQLGTVVKVLDFGISKVPHSTVQTQDSALLGTPQYMAPEQALGENKEAGPWTDVWALGSIAYEMLAGQPPFSAESVARVVFKVAYEPHTPLAQLRGDLPARMVQAVEGALLKRRDQRINDMVTFVTGFTGQPITLPEPSPTLGGLRAPSGVATPGSATDAASAFASTVAPATPQPGAAPSGAAPSGAAPSGAAPSGAAPSGAAPSGAAPSGAAQSGASPSGAAPSGATSGASPSGAAPSGAAPSGAAPSGAASGAAPSGAAPSGAASGAAPSETAAALAKPDRRSLAVRLAGGGLGLALVGASLFLMSRLNAPSGPMLAADAGLPAPSVVAGPILPDVTRLDAGLPAAIVAGPVTAGADAGASAPQDAGPAVASPTDAGATSPARPGTARPLPLTDAERAHLEELEALVRAKDWERAPAVARRVRRNLEGNPGAQARAYVLELHALCAVRSRGELQRAYNELLELRSSGASAAEARRLCKGFGINLEDVK